MSGQPIYTKDDLPNTGGIGSHCYDACVEEVRWGHDECGGNFVFFQCACPCHLEQGGTDGQ